LVLLTSENTPSTRIVNKGKKKGRAASCEAVVEPWEDNGPADLWIYQTGAHPLLRVARDAVK
jgi:hypothetical protein